MAKKRTPKSDPLERVLWEAFQCLHSAGFEIANLDGLRAWLSYQVGDVTFDGVLFRSRDGSFEPLVKSRNSSYFVSHCPPIRLSKATDIDYLISMCTALKRIPPPLYAEVNRNRIRLGLSKNKEFYRTDLYEDILFQSPDKKYRVLTGQSNFEMQHLKSARETGHTDYVSWTDHASLRTHIHIEYSELRNLAALIGRAYAAGRSHVFYVQLLNQAVARACGIDRPQDLGVDREFVKYERGGLTWVWKKEWMGPTHYTYKSLIEASEVQDISAISAE